MHSCINQVFCFGFDKLIIHAYIYIYICTYIQYPVNQCIVDGRSSTVISPTVIFTPAAYLFSDYKSQMVITYTFILNQQHLINGV